MNMQGKKYEQFVMYLLSTMQMYINHLVRGIISLAELLKQTDTHKENSLLCGGVHGNAI